MKRLRSEPIIADTEKEEESNPFPVGVFPVVEEVVLEILSIMYRLLLSDGNTQLSLRDEIVMRAVILLPHLSTTLFLQRFIPLIEYLPPDFWWRVRPDAIPLFKNLRRLNLSHSSALEASGLYFRSLSKVERLSLYEVSFNFTYVKEWSNLREIALSGTQDKTKFRVPDESCVQVFERLEKLVIDNTAEKNFELTDLVFDQIVTRCTNLKSLSLYYAPKKWKRLISPSLVRLSIDSSPKPGQLRLFTRLQHLNIRSKTAKFTEEALSSIAPTLRWLEVARLKARTPSITVLTNLNHLTVGYNGALRGEEFAVFTKLKALLIGNTGLYNAGDRHRLCLPPGLESLYLGKESAYYVSDKTLYNVPNLKVLTIPNNFDLTPAAFQRLPRLSELKIRTVSNFDDSVMATLSNLTKLSVRHDDSDTPASCFTSFGIKLCKKLIDYTTHDTNPNYLL